MSDEKISSWITKVDEALTKADKYDSNIDSRILKIPGMSGQKTRHYLNNLISNIGGRYLEVGVWQGSTFCSSMNKSKTNNFSMAVDNWAEFGGPKQNFLNNVRNFVDLENNKIGFLEKDFRTVTKKDLLIDKFGKFPIYLFDGPHKFQDQYDALALYINFLEDSFVFLCDDWNWTTDVEYGTRQAIKDLGITVHKEWVMTTPNNIDNDQMGWWNGYYTAVCTK
jgi:hypothetical protein